MHQKTKTQERLLRQAMSLREQIVEWMDPFAMDPKKRRKRSIFIAIISTAIVTILIIINAAGNFSHRNRCPKAPLGIVMYDVPSPISLINQNLDKLSQEILAKYPSAKELDFCSTNDGNIFKRVDFHRK